MLKISRPLCCGLIALACITIAHAAVIADDRVAVVVRNIAVLQPSAAGWLTHRDIVIRDTTITSIQPAGSNLVAQGATPADVLRRATIESARVHGRERDLGSIEIGKIADVLILNGDPLADIKQTRAIDAVIFRGEAMTRAHLNLLLSNANGTAVRR